eukprot:TRINITY_DN12985_c0_g1_i14.p1 TRINITY_DN12985_c0_g1~~TRINITY_DN12985_c0_g1_i14.p1  ORF type:complete len:281 (-),score=48.17 TRINITY_DN12985_c0_g1_i14:69-911(-)
MRGKNLPQITTTFKIFSSSLPSALKDLSRKSKVSANVTTPSTRVNPSSTKSKEGSQREAYSQELKSFVECSLQIVAEKVAYKKSLEAAIAGNCLECQKLREGINELEVANKELRDNCVSEVEKCNKLRETAEELQDLLKLLNEKVKELNHDLNCKLRALREVKDNLTKESAKLKESLKKLTKLKREERAQLKQEIRGIESTCYNTVARLKEVNDDICKSKTIKSDQLKMLTRNSSVLTSLTQRNLPAVSVKGSSLNKSIIKSVKTARAVRSRSICKNFKH